MTGSESNQTVREQMVREIEERKELRQAVSDYKGCLDGLKQENAELKKSLDRELANVSKLEEQLVEFEDLRMQLSEDVRLIEEEHNALISSPTALAANLAGLGFKGTIVREQPLYNTLVTDDGTVGTYTETIKIGQ